MQLTLTSPDITCDHCIATIRRTVDNTAGARFLEGHWETKQFAVEVTSGALLDSLSGALAAEGYSLGDAELSPRSADSGGVPADWRPDYRVTTTPAGADVNYACPCSCEAGFAFDRSHADQDPEHCCCGRTMLVGRDAEQRLRSAVSGAGAFTFDLQSVTMPWGQPIEVALAVPADPEHGAQSVP